ncbi:unnamed protein product [Rhizophagus irregularis]|uniref:BZIP domain-containing protein n=1 Tax=Rhizophagus irregularis TaxID=588596 RepID=A0A915ZUK7_9GLOM|nr:unnamed protein product [Rhizophagus irregularis]CAB4477866.1 unnamed protein product [Rhizophagus irregularis]CAB5215528.1 unnamed protein product [Rhizophagus irregularis]CAB5389055.1 unnamed protein product [Rhizophagus irregularis]CAB5389057.1 unnamed protein product [Rhizophagus irregularis]
MSDRSLPQRFRLPLPKPINGSFSSFKYNESPINNCIPNPQLSQTSSLDVIPCQQQTLNLHPIGKPMPNRRGRKPLATMPSGKKHVQNLTNQRAFRQRKENYIRSLELRASDLEMLYNSARDEIKTLNDRIAMLEKRLTSSRLIRSDAIKNVNNRDPNTHYGGIVNSAMYQAIIDNHTIYDENKDGPCDVIMNDQLPKDSDLFCEPITTSDERIWIASTSPTTTSPLYPTFVASNPSQNTRENGPTFPPSQDTEPQWIQPYFSQTSTAITSNHHRLNLKWILSDAPNEE